MDPNAALAQVRESMEAGRGLAGGATRAQLREAFDDLAAATEALDEWLANGGFPPAAWTGAPPIPLDGDEAVVAVALRAIKGGAEQSVVAEIFERTVLTVVENTVTPEEASA